MVRIIARLNVGGPARHVLLLAEGLRARGFETTVLHGDVDVGETPLQGARELAERGGFGLQRIPGLGPQIAPLQDARALAGLVAALRRERPAIVHTHTAKAGALGRLAARIAGVPVVVHTFHGHVLDHYFSPTGSRLVQLAERGLTRLSERLVTLSPRLRDELAHRYKVAAPEDIVVVPLGRDLAPFQAAARGALRGPLGLGDDALLIGAVGRLVPIKDLGLLVQAFAELAPAHPRAHLVLVGDGVSRGELEAHAARLGIAARVHFLGWRDDLPPVYADLDVVALTSKNEGTPLAIVEAFASGRPVVATAVGGVPDMFTSPANGGAPRGLSGAIQPRAEGFLVPSGAVAPLREALGCLLSRPELRAAQGQAARARAARFGAARLLDDTAALYHQLLATHAPAGTPP